MHLQETVLMRPNEDAGPASRHGGRMSPTRLMLIDDHLMITEALASRLSASTDLRELTAARPQARVIVLTSDHDVSHAVEAARAGVAAWVAKEQGAADLEAALRGVIKGESVYPPHMLGEILRELRADASRARQQ